MSKQSNTALYGVAAATVGAAVFFLATNKGRLFKKGRDGIKMLLSGRPDVLPTAPAPSHSGFEGRTPSPDNGHVRDVVATNPPPPDSGRNFTPQGDVHQPK